MILCFFFDAVCCFCSRMFSRHKFNRLVSKTKSSLPAPSTSQSARLLQDWPMHPCLILHYSQRLQTMLRRMLVTRRLLHVKGDVMCTVLLLVLFCFLLYARHVRMEVALFAVHVVSLLFFGLKEKSNNTCVSRLCSPLDGIDLCGSCTSTAPPAPVGPCWEPLELKWARTFKGYDPI